MKTKQLSNYAAVDFDDVITIYEHEEFEIDGGRVYLTEEEAMRLTYFLVKHFLKG